MQTTFKLPFMHIICTHMGCDDDTDKWEMVVICYRRISESCFHVPSIPINGSPWCGMCGMFDFPIPLPVPRIPVSQFADGTTADGSYQSPSYTVAGGVLFQLLTCTTAGTRAHCHNCHIVATLGSSTRQRSSLSAVLRRERVLYNL